MPTATTTRRTTAPRRRPAPAAGIDAVPLVEQGAGRRRRGRRGGPRTPLPLLPLIAICCGVAIAYVSQTARATQAGYEVSTLASQQSALRQEDERLGDELARLSSAERIVAAAQRMGMRPATRWSYVASAPVPVVPVDSPAQVASDGTTDGPVEHLVAAFDGSYGLTLEAGP